MAEEAFIKSTFDFALKLFKEVSKEFKENDFFVYSPLSIQSCLTLLYMGAEGISAKSIAEALAYNQKLSKVDIACLIKHLMEQSEEEDSIEVANAIFLLDPSAKISDFYKKIIQTYFHSSIEPLTDNEQKLVKAINDWLSKATHKRMKEMLTAQDLVDSAKNERKKMIVLDALYFKGRWAYAFDKALTVKRKFWHTKEAFIEVPTMQITNFFNYARFEELKFSVLELNYVDSELSLMIFLPDEPSQLTLIEENADQLKLYDIVTMLYLKTVQVFLPKFTLETKFDLKNSFKAMGMENLFTADANFKGIFEKKGTCVDSIFHKTVFAVDEEGTAVYDKDFGKVDVVFDVNRSFFFCLKHKFEHNVVISGCVRKF
ncbi:serpin B4-like [Culicoides brevitarsis]|uniref:serpin B4-like n=1 Tax=Culicoides brevitarsis TaxID=469753 RepID=UPI00307B5CE3